MAEKAIRQNEIAPIPLFKPGERQNEFFTSPPSHIKVPLVGTEIIKFELEPAVINSKYQKQGVNTGQIIANYQDFIETTVKTLHDEGYKKPANEKELRELCLSMCSLVWSNFTVSDTDLLADGFAQRTLEKCGTLDCDTSSHVFADILNQFGVSSSLVSITSPGHVILHVKGTGASFYLETLPNNDFCIYDSEKALKASYPSVSGECRFSTVNYITYSNRGIVRSDLGDYLGAIADYTKAIWRNPKFSDAYNNRGNAKSKLEDYKGALVDYSKAISVGPLNFEAYINRSFLRSILGDRQGSHQDMEMAKKIAKILDSRP